MKSDATRSWMLSLAACLVVVFAAEMLMLYVSTGYFKGGFNSVAVGGPGTLLGLLIGAALLDGAFVLGLWLVAVPMLGRVVRSRFELFCMSGLIALAVALATAVAHYRLHVTLGHVVSVSLLRVGSAGSSVGGAAMLLDGLPSSGILLSVLALGSGLAVIAALRRVAARLDPPDHAFAPPGLGQLLLVFLVAAVAGLSVLDWSRRANERLHYGLERTVGGLVLPLLVQRLTDFDLDGYGLLARPADPAPFDAAIWPYAVDLPGNGVDEDGLGGDHPVDFRLDEARTERAAVSARPHLLLLYLESFRADLIERRLDGREITPAFNRLAAEGARSDAAHAHSPWTIPSRAQLFQGTLMPQPGAETLVDDFKARGYQVAYFSGQDDSYGDSTSLVGTERADVFYHARDDLLRRTTRTTAPVSLQVSWKTVLERVFAFLDSADTSRPIFLYVNLVDTHFPYDHDELDDVLGVGRLSRSEIRADAAARVFASYANAAANVDRGAAALLARWHRLLEGQPRAILVTADHGQAFYEDGVLGHGQQLVSAQTRVPFLIWGVGGLWPEPLAPSDVRSLLLRNLFAPRGDEPPRARFEPDPARSLFQYLGRLREPEQIALRWIDRVVVQDVKNQHVWQLDATGQRLPSPPSDVGLRSVILTWEALNLRLASKVAQ